MSGLELLPITKELYQQMVSIAWLMLGPMFLLSCTIHYAKDPANFPYLDMLHRIVITVALLMFFPEITKVVSDIAGSLNERIGDRHAIDALFEKVKQQTDPQSQSSNIPFLLTADAWLALLNYISYAVVYIAKYLMLATYHFFWSLLMAVAPLAILCNLFQGTSHITKNLFASLIEISLWQVMWQIMSTMLLGLNILHPTGSNYFDAICFNFLLAVGLVRTPKYVNSLLRGGLVPPASMSAVAMLGAVVAPVAQVVSAVATTKQVALAAAAARQRFRRPAAKGN